MPVTDSNAHTRLAIILIHHRMEDHLRRCLRSIQEQKTPWELMTVVVHLKTDEDDGGWIVEEFPWVQLEFAQRFGIAHMRNIGLRAARGAEFSLILDADARLRPGALAALVEFAESNKKAGAVGPRTVRSNGTLERNAKRFYTWLTVAARRSPLEKLFPNNPWRRRHLNLDRDWTQPFDSDWVAGAAMLLRGEALEEIGYFDERFIFGFEDVDWCFRAGLAGWRVRYCPSATIEHHIQRRSARGFNAMTAEHLKSLWRFWRKHKRLSL